MKPQDYARKLHDALSAARRLMRRADLAAWGRSFADLITLRGEEEVRPVFEWYLAHLTDSFVPQVNSAKSFFDKFINLKDAMARAAKAGPGKSPEAEAQPPAVPLTEREVEDCQRLARRLGRDLGWPFGLEKELPELVRQSYPAVKEFFERLRPVAYLGRNWPHSWTGGALWAGCYAADCFKAQCLTPLDMIEEWLERTHRRVKRWTEPYKFKPLVYLNEDMKKLVLIVLHRAEMDHRIDDMLNCLADRGESARNARPACVS